MTQQNTDTNHQPTWTPLLHFARQKSTTTTLAVLCIIIIIITSITGIFHRKGIRYDQTRLTDFSKIQSNINAFYSTNRTLPENLDELEAYSERTRSLNAQRFNRLPTDYSSITDPETKKNYNYKILTNYSYDLCTTF